MPRRGKRLGFQEMSPFKVAHELFREKISGEKIAIVTRIDDAVVSEIVQLLRERGLQVRVIAGQSGLEDWCFMRRAQKELVGCAVSSFVRWAAFLGEANSTRLYFLDSPAFRQRGDLDFMFQEAMYLMRSHLRYRIRYEIYRSEEIELLINENVNFSLRFEPFDQLLALHSTNETAVSVKFGTDNHH
jgi:hypothetical protein